jgi:hypothetical protein
VGFDLTRRRGDAEISAENTKNKAERGNVICPFPGWRAEPAESAEEALLRTEGVQGIGFGAAAGGTGHGEDGRGGQQESGAAIE